MNKIREFLKGRTGGIVLCVAEIVIGVLLLIDPIGFTGRIIIGAGIILAAMGALHVIRYFMARPEVAAAQQLLFRGLLLLMGGALCITRHEWFTVAFPLLTVLYAGWMLVVAAMKLQKMADLLRVKNPRWYLPGIAAALAAVLAAIILVNPFSAASAVWTFVAISLIAEAAMELIGAILK